MGKDWNFPAKHVILKKMCLLFSLDSEKFYQIERKFGISEEYYFSMLEKQGFKCEICKIPLEDYKNQGYRDFFSVDHDHKTGKIRGLLCDKCNRALGFFGENEETLLNAAEYIRKYKI